MKASISMGLGAAAVACFAWIATQAVWQSPTESTPSQAGTQEIDRVSIRPRSELGDDSGPRPGQRSESVVPTASPSSKLAAELLAATDWRAFALSARARPEHGGYFYAMHVTDLCGTGIAAMPHLAETSVGKAVTSTGTVSPAHVAMMEAWVRQCASFAAGEASELHRGVQQLAADRRDPILNAVQDLSMRLKQADGDATKAALSALLGLEEPLAIFKDSLIERVMSAGPESRPAGSLWFNGKSYGIDDPEARTILDLALTFAACSSSTRCELDEQMMLACLGGQFCTQDRVAYLRKRYLAEAGMSEEHYRQAQALAVQIQDAVARRDVDAFIRR